MRFHCLRESFAVTLDLGSEGLSRGCARLHRGALTARDVLPEALLHGVCQRPRPRGRSGRCGAVRLQGRHLFHRDLCGKVKAGMQQDARSNHASKHARKQARKQARTQAQRVLITPVNENDARNAWMRSLLLRPLPWQRLAPQPRAEQCYSAARPRRSRRPALPRLTRPSRLPGRPQGQQPAATTHAQPPSMTTP